jgi:intergrase/recombinase
MKPRRTMMSDAALNKREIEALLAGVDGENPEKAKNATNAIHGIAETAMDFSIRCLSEFNFVSESMETTAQFMREFRYNIHRLIVENSGVDITDEELRKLAGNITNTGIGPANTDKKIRRIIRKNSAGIFVLFFYCYSFLEKLREMEDVKIRAMNVLRTVAGLAKEELWEYES